jgi:peptidyl-prolyl cis-trans isomerase A (cyclophilin A)
MNKLRIALFTLSAALPALAFAQATPSGAPAKPAAAPAAPAKPAASGACSIVKLTTSMGPITIALDQLKAPVSSENFAKYVKSGHYNGTIFHRVIGTFMIQGGGFTRDMQQKPTEAPIRNEASNGLKNEPYTVAMARTNDPNSATSQFFINVVDNAMLNYMDDMKPGYAVFGKVIAGKETVDKIKAVPVGNHPAGHQNVPTTPVVLEKAECQ